MTKISSTKLLVGKYCRLRTQNNERRYAERFLPSHGNVLRAAMRPADEPFPHVSVSAAANYGANSGINLRCAYGPELGLVFRLNRYDERGDGMAGEAFNRPILEGAGTEPLLLWALQALYNDSDGVCWLLSVNLGPQLDKVADFSFTHFIRTIRSGGKFADSMEADLQLSDLSLAGFNRVYGGFGPGCEEIMGCRFLIDMVVSDSLDKLSRSTVEEPLSLETAQKLRAYLLGEPDRS